MKCKQCGKETNNKNGLCSEECFDREEKLIEALAKAPLRLPF